jgi:hypothetical protein
MPSLTSEDQHFNLKTAPIIQLLSPKRTYCMAGFNFLLNWLQAANFDEGTLLSEIHY